MRRYVGPGSVLAFLVLLASSDVAAAHELGADRFTAPIPLSALFLGAGATVALTAIWLARSGRPAPASRRSLVSFPARATRSLFIASRALFSLFVLLAVLHGLTGRQVAAENVATLFVWPVWLKGVALVAIVLGSPWLVISPWRGLHTLFERIEGGSIRLRAYPEWLGTWPAFLGFVLIVGIVENLTVVPRSPGESAGLVALYAGLMVAGGLAFGTGWFRHADFFEVLYGQFGRVAVFQASAERGTTWTLSIRTPWQGCTTPSTRPGLVAFVVAMVYTVSFDGFTNTPEYQALHFGTQDTLAASAPGLTSWTGVLLYVVGLTGFVVFFLVAMAFVEHSGSSAGGVLATARAFAPTVIPIAAAYEIAHNYLYVLVNLPPLVDALRHAVDAPGFSIWTLLPALPSLGSLIPQSAVGLIAVPAFWASQVVLIVAGHVVAVVAAHAVAVDRFGSVERARRAHLPLVVVMVAYTVLSLWIISRPVVSG